MCCLYTKLKHGYKRHNIITLHIRSNNDVPMHDKIALWPKICKIEVSYGYTKYQITFVYEYTMRTNNIRMP